MQNPVCNNKSKCQRAGLVLNIVLLIVAVVLVVSLDQENVALISAVLMAVLGVMLVLTILNARYLHSLESDCESMSIQSDFGCSDVTLNSIADAVITTDAQQKVRYMNPVAERLTGWSMSDAREKPVTDIFVLDYDEHDPNFLQPVQDCLENLVTVKNETDVSLIECNGSQYEISYSISPIMNHKNELIGSVIVFQHMDKERGMSEMIAYQATHDELTDLINRREFERRFKKLIETANDKASHVLCYIDLDQFKVVNDTCGHYAGDQLLKQIGHLLESEVREEDTLARLGGDEFGVLLENCELEDALRIAEQLIDVVKKYRFIWEGKTFEVGIGIGIVQVTSENILPSEVMSFADSACYIAKEKGRNMIHVYQPDDDAMIKRKGEMQWVHRITEAYTQELFVLYAQEIVPVANRTHGGKHYELLIRMLDESGQIIPPMEYVTAAERYNMMADLDRWVIHNAFDLIHRYEERIEKENLKTKIFAINLSGQSLNDSKTMSFLKEEFTRYPKLASSVIFEITETAAISNLSQAYDFISTFKGNGVKFALDDFGSGLSSFAYLKNLNVDYLKIDGEFVKDMDCDPINFAMVGSINQIGHIMGIKTIAEHVVSDDIRDMLMELGVDYGQGNWLSEPRP
ncbi:MAG: EAL domain-containing protein, partial [Gammaproteobacteria bacterium]|nr:EAL domain-containing protein [Gammaproteobacteria bacterium]